MHAGIGGGDLGDGFDHVLAVDDFTEYGIAEITTAMVEEIVVVQIDEELAGRTVDHLGAGHGDGVLVVTQAVVGFVLDRFADVTLLHVGGKAAALDHETRYHPVEDQAVIVSGIGVAQKVLDTDRSGFGIELQFDIAMGGLEQYLRVVCQGGGGGQHQRAGGDKAFQHGQSLQRNG